MCFGTEQCVQKMQAPKDADRMANRVDPDQEQSDLDPHCLHRPVRCKT